MRAADFSAAECLQQLDDVRSFLPGDSWTAAPADWGKLINDYVVLGAPKRAADLLRRFGYTDGLREILISYAQQNAPNEIEQLLNWSQHQTNTLSAIEASSIIAEVASAFASNQLHSQANKFYRS